jgi:hypothetical protein
MGAFWAVVVIQCLLYLKFPKLANSVRARVGRWGYSNYTHYSHAGIITQVILAITAQLGLFCHRRVRISQNCSPNCSLAYTACSLVGNAPSQPEEFSVVFGPLFGVDKHGFLLSNVWRFVMLDTMNKETENGRREAS